MNSLKKKDVFIGEFSRLRLTDRRIEFKQSFGSLYLGLFLFMSIALFITCIVKVVESEPLPIIVPILAVISFLIGFCFRCYVIDLDEFIVAKKVMIWNSSIFHFKTELLNSNEFSLDCYETNRGKDRVTLFILKQGSITVINFNTSDTAIDFYREVKKNNVTINLIKSNAFLDWEKL